MAINRVRVSLSSAVYREAVATTTPTIGQQAASAAVVVGMAGAIYGGFKLLDWATGPSAKEREEAAKAAEASAKLKTEAINAKIAADKNTAELTALTLADIKAAKAAEEAAKAAASAAAAQAAQQAAAPATAQ